MQKEKKKDFLNGFKFRKIHFDALCTHIMYEFYRLIIFLLRAKKEDLTHSADLLHIPE